MMKRGLLIPILLAGLLFAGCVPTAVVNGAQPLTYRGSHSSTYVDPSDGNHTMKVRVSTEQQTGEMRAVGQFNVGVQCCNDKTYVYWSKIWKDGVVVEKDTYNKFVFSSSHEADLHGTWYTVCSGSHTWQVEFSFYIMWPRGVHGNDIDLKSYTWTGGC